MRNYLSVAILLAFSCSITAQIGTGIGTIDPQTSLHMDGRNPLGSVSSTDGMLVPRVNDLTADGSQNGQLVFLTQDISNFTSGFHYWDGLSWVRLLSRAYIFKQQGNVLSETSGRPDPNTDNFLIGHNAGRSLRSGTSNIIVGISPGTRMTGSDNVVLGDQAGKEIFGGNRNVAIGRETLRDKDRGVAGDANDNIAIGLLCIDDFNGDTDHNIALGRNTFESLFGSNNIGIGYIFGDNQELESSYNIGISRSGNFFAEDQDGQLSIQNAIYGTNNTGTLNEISNGNIGLFVKDPQAKLDVLGTTSDESISLLLRSGNLGSTSAYSQIAFSPDSNNYRHVIRTRHDEVADENAIDFKLWSPSQASTALGELDAMTIKQSQDSTQIANVGINTATPTEAVDVDGLVKSDAYIQTAVIDDPDGDFSTSNPNGHSGQNVSKAVYIYTTATTVELPPLSTFPKGRIINFKSTTSAGSITLNAAGSDYFENIPALQTIKVHKRESLSIINYENIFWVVLSEI